MEKYMQPSKDEIVMGFVASCIESVADALGVGYREIFERMDKVGMIDEYIYPCYETLHTESRKNLTKSLIETLDRWEHEKDLKDILRWGSLGIIACRIAENLSIPPLQALKDFFRSETCEKYHDRTTKLYLYSENYIADSYLIEKGLYKD